MSDCHFTNDQDLPLPPWTFLHIQHPPLMSSLIIRCLSSIHVHTLLYWMCRREDAFCILGGAMNISSSPSQIKCSSDSFQISYSLQVTLGTWPKVNVQTVTPSGILWMVLGELHSWSVGHSLWTGQVIPLEGKDEVIELASLMTLNVSTTRTVSSK